MAGGHLNSGISGAGATDNGLGSVVATPNALLIGKSEGLQARTMAYIRHHVPVDRTDLCEHPACRRQSPARATFSFNSACVRSDFSKTAIWASISPSIFLRWTMSSR